MQSKASNVSVATFTKVTPESVAALQTAVAQQPISVSIDAETAYFQTYKSGVLTDATACGVNIDHAVLAVGFGTDALGNLYIKIKNSWGTSWGENGYIKLEKFGEGKEPCGTDTAPESGFVCEGGPSTITVCGTSGMLSGSSYPTGAKLL